KSFGSFAELDGLGSFSESRPGERVQSWIGPRDRSEFSSGRGLRSSHGKGEKRSSSHRERAFSNRWAARSHDLRWRSDPGLYDPTMSGPRDDKIQTPGHSRRQP